MPGHRPIDAVLFDLDGVLTDTEPWWDDVRREVAAAHGRPWTPEDQAAVMGANTAEWSSIMRDRLGLPAVTPERIRDAVVDGVVAAYRHRPSPAIGDAAAQVRRIAATHRVAIASSAARPVIEAALDHLGLEDAFGAVVSADEVARGKPAPDVYLRAAALLGVAPGRCIVVEDSLNGVRAGRAAGAFVVLVPSPSIRQAGAEELADLVLTGLSDLDPGRIGT